jgi:hypothetical protein
VAFSHLTIQIFLERKTQLRGRIEITPRMRQAFMSETGDK